MAERRQSRRQSRKQSRRASSRRRQSTGFVGKKSKPNKMPKKELEFSVQKALRDYIKSHKDDYLKYFEEVRKKNNGFLTDCRYGRNNFINWLTDVLRTIGLFASQESMPGYPLGLYGPEGCPNAVFAYTANPQPKKWTLCIMGNYDQAEDRWKDPALLLDGRFFPKRNLPEGVSILICWLAAIQTFAGTGNWPINIKLVWTANRSEDAPVMVKFIKKYKQTFFDDVDFFCLCTTLRSTMLPAGIVYGGRGSCHFLLEVADGRLEDYCSCEVGPIRQTATDIVSMLDDLEKDCVYSYLKLYDAFNLPKRFKDIVNTSYVVDLDPELGFWQRPEVLKWKEKNFTDMWKPEVQLKGLTGFPKNDHLKAASRVQARFAVKYMSETAPCRIEEMVNRLLKKKWDSLGSTLSCKLSMDYWARPWFAEGCNQLYNVAKKAIKQSFHRPPVESIDFNPNPLPAILQILTAKQMIVLSLAAMVDLKKESLKQNYLRNIKMLVIFICNLQTATTALEYKKKFNKRREETADVRRELLSIHKIREKKIHVSIDS